LNIIVDVIIPAFNEENSVEKVIKDFPAGSVRDIIVVNNNSNDATAYNAAAAGATVLHETFQGYGAACLKGMEFIAAKDIKPDIVVFVDADYSDHPEQVSLLLDPIIDNGYDMVIGSRTIGHREKGSMTIQQRFGNILATGLLRILYKTVYTDLGPFRAIKYSSLLALKMKDKTYGWTVEMQLKAAKQKMRTCEVAVDYRKRIGFSKISGTVKGTVMAGYKIIVTIFRYL
jgi:glycosyltransferase involved in cell wall biosynthesis